MNKFLLFFILFISYIFNEEVSINKTSNIKFFNKTFEKQPLNNLSIKKKNVILGIIQNYSLSKIFPFFKSLLFANIKNCDVIIFIRNVSIDVIKYLKTIDVLIIKISDKYKNVNAINLRWKLYFDFLKENENKYNLVLHVDIRDTFFQKDFFEYYENYKPFLGVAIEDGYLNKGVNKKWIIEYVGVDKHKIIENKRIICVGTIWGTIDIFMNFSINFWNKLMENPDCMEQGIANYMFYYDKIFENYLVKSDNYGPVMTLGITKRENIVLDSENNVLNFKGEKAAIIHQYDRKPDIVNKVIQKFCPELINFWSEINKIKKYYKNIQFNQTKNMEKKYKNIIYMLIFFQFFILIIIYKYFVLQNN